LEHYAVSREHVRIDYAGESVFIEDLNSRNGVLVNGLPIQPGVAGRQRLLPHDRIEIAAFEFVFEE
jgi:pSer/pThr/pTyr-binding forkhead associated (FHA) protein